MARAMAQATIVFLLISLSAWVVAYNDMFIDKTQLPRAGSYYTLEWSNLQGTQVKIDLDEITNPGGNLDAAAGLRVGYGNNTGYADLYIPLDVRSDVQYHFQIRNNEDTSSWSQSDDFYIQGASGEGLPSLSYQTTGTAVIFHISTETPLSTSTDYSTTTDDAAASTFSPTTSTSSAPPTSSSAPPASTGSGAASSSSPPPTSPPLGQDTSSQTPSPSSSHSHSLSSGAIAGITISILLLALAGGAGLLIFFFRRRRRRQRQQSGDGEPHVAEIEQQPTKPYSDKEVHSPSANDSDPSSSQQPSQPSDPSDSVGGMSPAAQDRHTWSKSNTVSVHSPLSELAATPVQGRELDGSERSATGTARDEGSSSAQTGGGGGGGSGGWGGSTSDGYGDGDRDRDADREQRRSLLELPERGSSMSVR